MKPVLVLFSRAFGGKMEPEAFFGSRGALEQYLRRLVQNHELRPRDYASLKLNRQTKGLAIDYYIEDYPAS